MSVLERYDGMMERYVADREARFDAMLDAVATLVGDSFVALDAGCGPGSLSKRLLQRFPHARCAGVDADPTMLDIARPLIRASGSHLSLTRADLVAPAGIPAFERERFDVVLTTSSTHYLDRGQLRRFYRLLGDLTRPGGVLLNGDELAVDPELPALQALARTAADVRNRDADRRGVEDWAGWWQSLGLAPPSGSDDKQTLSAHRLALQEAGFDQATSVWQRLDSHVLLATKAGPISGRASLGAMTT